jgi:hypothetical protein
MKSMFISVAMLLALSVPALADDDKNKGDNGGVRSRTGQVEFTIEADDELRLIVRRRAASGSMTKEPLINLRIMAHCAFDSRATVWTGS